MVNFRVLPFSDFLVIRAIQYLEMHMHAKDLTLQFFRLTIIMTNQFLLATLKQSRIAMPTKLKHRQTLLIGTSKRYDL